MSCSISMMYQPHQPAVKTCEIKSTTAQKLLMNLLAHIRVMHVLLETANAGHLTSSTEVTPASASPCLLHPPSLYLLVINQVITHYKTHLPFEAVVQSLATSA